MQLRFVCGIKILKKYGLIFLLGVLVGCASRDTVEEDLPLEKLYTNGLKAYKEKSYKQAIKCFSAIERQYPYSNWAIKAQIMNAYCQYLTRSYDEAIENFKLFTQLHPHYQEIPYVLYMIGLCYYEQLSIIERDQSTANDAIEVFNDLIQRFSGTKYSQDAREKVLVLLDHLAGKLVAVGRFYEKRGNYTGAINRFKDVERLYPSSAHVPESYLRLTECYISIGQYDEAKKIGQKLISSYPQTVWAGYARNLLKNA